MGGLKQEICACSIYYYLTKHNVFHSRTSVTAGAVVRSLVVALLAGVVAEVALPTHGVAPLLAKYVTAAIVKEPGD